MLLVFLALVLLPSLLLTAIWAVFGAAWALWAWKWVVFPVLLVGFAAVAALLVVAQWRGEVEGDVAPAWFATLVFDFLLLSGMALAWLVTFQFRRWERKDQLLDKT